MDLYVERQCIQQMKDGNIKQFLLLFESSFVELYKYVARRVGEGEVAEKIIRLTFLDALGQMQATPIESAYIVWLYGLAKPRVWEEISRSSFPEKQGLISAVQVDGPQASENEEAIARVEKMMRKLSLEEREIFRLKFFEEVSDGDVMTILNISEGAIGSKIYRVLKRAHFLLFGESDERQGVYFGELTGLLSRVRELEKVIIPEVLKLNLKADLSARIDRREFAINSEPMEEEVGPKEPPVMVVTDAFKGSNDPAKIFVAAVKEMREEEEVQKMQDQLMFQREEKLFDFFEKWKGFFIGVPTAVFLGLVGLFVFSFFGGGTPTRGYPTSCKIEVAYKGDFSDGEKRNVNQGISDKICGHFDVKKLLISRLDDGKVQVNVDVPQWLLEYKFAKKIQDANAGVAAAVNAGPWRIKEYARTLSSNEKSGKV